MAGKPERKTAPALCCTENVGKIGIFAEISVDMPLQGCYSGQVTEKSGSIEVQFAGYLSLLWKRVSGGREGATAEEQRIPVSDALGCEEYILRTVTFVERYHSGVIICRECWSFSGFAVFCWQIMKGC